MATFHNSPANYFSRTQQLQQNMPQLQQTQISESPIVQTPGGPVATQTPNTVPTTSSSGKPAGPKRTTSKKRLTQFVALGALALTVISGGAGLYLMGESQDTRQQASVPDGIGRMTLDPATGEFPHLSTQEIEVKLNMGAAIPVNGIQGGIDITGDVPDDIEFIEAVDLEGLAVSDIITTDIPNGKRIIFGFLATPPNPFTTPTGDLVLGTIVFSPPESGSMSMQFNPSASKVIKEEGSGDILLTPSQIATYTFAPAIEDNSAIDDTVQDDVTQTTTSSIEVLTATLSGAMQVPRNSSLASGSAIMSYDLEAETFSLQATISGILPERITKTTLLTGTTSSNGTLIMDLGKSWATSSGKLSLVVTDTDFPASHSASLFEGEVYLTVATTTYPNGEIRGSFVFPDGLGGMETTSALDDEDELASPSPSPSASPRTYLDDDTVETASAAAYEMPVTGAFENTLLLVALGVVMIGIGGYVSLVTRSSS